MPLRVISTVSSASAIRCLVLSACLSSYFTWLFSSIRRPRQITSRWPQSQTETDLDFPHTQAHTLGCQSARLDPSKKRTNIVNATILGSRVKSNFEHTLREFKSLTDERLYRLTARQHQTIFTLDANKLKSRLSEIATSLSIFRLRITRRSKSSQRTDLIIICEARQVPRHYFWKRRGSFQPRRLSSRNRKLSLSYDCFGDPHTAYPILDPTSDLIIEFPATAKCQLIRISNNNTIARVQ